MNFIFTIFITLFFIDYKAFKLIINIKNGDYGLEWPGTMIIPVIQSLNTNNYKLITSHESIDVFLEKYFFEVYDIKQSPFICPICNVQYNTLNDMQKCNHISIW